MSNDKKEDTLTWEDFEKSEEEFYEFRNQTIVELVKYHEEMGKCIGEGCQLCWLWDHAIEHTRETLIIEQEDLEEEKAEVAGKPDQDKPESASA